MAASKVISRFYPLAASFSTKTVLRPAKLAPSLGENYSHFSGSFRHFSLSPTLHARSRSIPPSLLVAQEFLDSAAALKDNQTINFTEIIGDQRQNPFNPSLLPEEVQYPGQALDLPPEQTKVSEEILSTVNRQIDQESHGRLFAVIHMGYKQWRVTEGDIIMLNGTYHLAAGQKIKIEKVLAVGSTDFTLLGRPMLDRDLVRIDATCIEKSSSYPIIYFRHWKQIPLRHYRFNRIAQTMVRINHITFNRHLNQAADREKTVHTVI